MKKSTDSSYKKYWDENISRWGDLYLNISHGHEKLSGVPGITWLYNRFIVPYEAKLMKVRFQKTVEFIDRYVGEGKTLNDLGCGTGIFVVKALQCGASVNAIDLSGESLKITESNVKTKSPEGQDRVTYTQADAQTQSLPKSDACLCVGVLPYVTDVEAFLGNLLDATNVAFIQFTDKYNFSNRIRRLFPFLNVRNLQFQTLNQLETIASKIGFEVIHCEDFATGKLVTLARGGHDPLV